jgi:hypothetical protein
VRFKELLDSWRDAAADSPTAKSYAVRLPLDEAAQLLALAEMFPGRTVEQLISELLAAALKETAAAMPYVAGRRVIATDEQGDPIYEDVGPTPRFIALARQHRRALQGDAQPANPPVLQPAPAERPPRRSARGKGHDASSAAPKGKPRRSS